MNDYLIMALVGLLFVVLGYLSARSKPNAVLGVRLPATYADPEVWRKTNQKCAQIMYILGPVISVVSLLFYFTGTPPEIGGGYLGFGLLAVVVLMGVYLYFYSKNLLEKVLAQPGATTVPTNQNAGTSQAAVILLLIMGITVVVLGILMICSHAGTSLGIRAGHVFRDAATWHKVNTVGGIGDIIIGAFFTFYFARFIPGVKNPRTFYRAVFSFVAAIIVWAIVSAIYAYIV
ncbi:MAG: SdpI family protein [Caldiserica bacterium]|nr:SdpI family protein [Caldisericota bacterium]